MLRAITDENATYRKERLIYGYVKAPRPRASTMNLLQPEPVPHSVFLFTGRFVSKTTPFHHADRLLHVTERVCNDAIHTLPKKQLNQGACAFRRIAVALPVLENAVSDFRFILELRKSSKRPNQHWIITKEDDVTVPTEGARVLCILPLNNGEYIRIPVCAGPLRRHAHAKQGVKLLRFGRFHTQVF